MLVGLCFFGAFLFFFKQKTAYEMRISDWSSDVCSSDLFDQRGARAEGPFAPGGDDLDVRLQRIVAELEAHLVVALAGRPVGDRVGAGLGGDLDLQIGRAHV